MKQELRPIVVAFIWPAIYVTLLWLFFALESWYSPLSEHFALVPRDIQQWWGPFTFPLMHGDLGHLFWNSIPLLVLGTTVFYFYRTIALEAVFWIWIMGGIWTWIFARPSFHIGSSGIIYGLAAFIIFSGMWRRNKALLTIGLLMVFLYGSMFYGIFPIEPNVSWEGHLSGAMAGALVAWFFRKKGPADEPPPNWDDDPDDDYPYWLEGNNEIDENAQPIRFRYRYKTGTGLDGE